MNRIKELRTAEGISQQRLAQVVGTTQRNISYWESGVEINAQYATRIANFFDVTVDYLLGLEDDFGVKVASADNAGSPTTAEERKLLADYRALPEELRALVREQMALFTKADGIFTEKK